VWLDTLIDETKKIVAPGEEFTRVHWERLLRGRR
jgi:hypothetical protein